MASLLNMSGGSLLKKGLPYDAEIEYLESTGTQYIDTGIKGSSSLNLETKASGLESVSNTAIIGSRNRSNTPTDSYIIFSSTGRIRFDYGGDCNWVVDSRKEDQMIINTNKNVLTTNTGITISNTPVYFTTNYNLIMFGLNQGINGISPRSVTIYYMKIWDNTILIRDFIPVVKDGVGYMYDKVSGQLFGNAGRGSFIVGPRVS